MVTISDLPEEGTSPQIDHPSGNEELSRDAKHLTSSDPPTSALSSDPSPSPATVFESSPEHASEIEDEDPEPNKERTKRFHDLVASAGDKPLPQMTWDDKMAFVDRYRVAGNIFFSEKKYKWAKQTYREAMTVIQHGLHIGEKTEDGEDGDSIQLGGPGKPLNERSKAAMLTFASNYALCCLKTKDWAAALQHCNKAEDTGAPMTTDVKAKLYFRRAEALRGLGDLNKALAQYVEANRLKPEDKATELAMQRCKQQVNKLKKEEANRAKEIWSDKLKEEFGPTPEDVAVSDASARLTKAPNTASTNQCNVVEDFISQLFSALYRLWFCFLRLFSIGPDPR